MTHEMRPTSLFEPFAARMRAADLPDVVIRNFAHYFEQLLDKKTGLIPEAEIEPVTALPDADALPAERELLGREALPATVVIKLNGGLGTGMGLAAAKSLLPVKQGLSFLDIIARQSAAADVPLLLMNSFSTRDDTLRALRQYSRAKADLPWDFLQHKVPKILQDGLRPAEWPAAPELAWCPPGHGDLYTALVTSGMLDRLLAAGCRTAFVSNSDNLGAVVDERLLGHFVAEGLSVMIEVTDRTPADCKGGHLARRRQGGLVLRESAQCPPGDVGTFQDVELHRYFNTNNLWLNLKILRREFDACNGLLELPMIRNGKTLDPRDSDTPAVWQLETAMGSAIEVFADAGAVRVPPTRFAPIKTTNDLLDVRSDNYVLTPDHRVAANPARRLPRAVIDLDPDCYGFVDKFDARFPAGPPSLLNCARLTVRGDVVFGRDVVIEGDAELVNDTGRPARIPDGARLSGAWRPE